MKTFFIALALITVQLLTVLVSIPLFFFGVYNPELKTLWEVEEINKRR